MALPIEKPRTFLSPGYQDNLGWGFGTALGAKARVPDGKVLAIAGDGGFMYQVGELATAVRHNLAVVVVVFDNGGFGNGRSRSPIARPSSSTPPGVDDVVALADELENRPGRVGRRRGRGRTRRTRHGRRRTRGPARHA